MPADAASYGWARGATVVMIAALVAGTVMTVVDLLFLGIIARAFYDEALGALRRPGVYWPAAAAFYVLYVGVIVLWAALPARSLGDATKRGAGMGFFAYAVYELTNWAVIAGWPGQLVAVDIAWGTFLTGFVAASTYAAVCSFRPTSADWMCPFPIRMAPGETAALMWARRALSVSLVTTLWAVAWLGSPLWVLAALVIDLSTGSSRTLPRVRALIFFMFFLGAEVWGLVAGAVIWLLSLGGRIVSHDRYVRHNAKAQAWWTEALSRCSFRIFSARREVDGASVARKAPFVLLVRHTSPADTVLAACIVANRFDILLRYVLKRELLWDPCLDVFGHRLPVVFIARKGADRQAAVEAVASLGEDLDDRSAVLIYPEGTRFSPTKREKRIAELRESGRDDLARIAERMKHALAPKTSGVLRLLDENPHLDLVILAHHGMEGAASFGSFLRGGLVGRTVRVRLWRIQSTDVPCASADRERWLFERWAEIDEWIDALPHHRGQELPC